MTSIVRDIKLPSIELHGSDDGLLFQAGWVVWRRLTGSGCATTEHFYVPPTHWPDVAVYRRPSSVHMTRSIVSGTRLDTHWY